MPDLGHLKRDRLPHALPFTSPLYPPAPWPLPGARVLKLTFETDADTLLRWLPSSLGRTSPAYAIITVAHYPESPIGPFSLATQYLGCRARIFIRAFALHAVTDNARALPALRELWGVPAKLGAVSLTEEATGASATVSVDGRTVAELRMSAGEPCDPQLIRFDPMLTVRLVANIQEGRRFSLMEMAQIDPELKVNEVVRGRGHLTYPDSSEGDPWRLLPALNVISAFHCVMDTELPLARFIVPY